MLHCLLLLFSLHFLRAASLYILCWRTNLDHTHIYSPCLIEHARARLLLSAHLRADDDDVSALLRTLLPLISVFFFHLTVVLLLPRHILYKTLPLSRAPAYSYAGSSFCVRERPYPGTGGKGSAPSHARARIDLRHTYASSHTASAHRSFINIYRAPLFRVRRAHLSFLRCLRSRANKHALRASINGGICGDSSGMRLNVLHHFACCSGIWHGKAGRADIMAWHGMLAGKGIELAGRRAGSSSRQHEQASV